MSNETKWTPGPWRVDGDTFGWEIVRDDRARCIGWRFQPSSPEMGGPDADEARANAELVASAPQLHAENKKLLDLLRRLRHPFSENGDASLLEGIGVDHEDLLAELDATIVAAGHDPAEPPQPE